MIYGIDEAGKGPVIGSLFVAMVGVSSLQKLENLGIRDSKKLSKSKRKKIYDQLQGILDYQKVVRILPKDIDGGNILELECKSIEWLIRENAADNCIIDCPHPNPKKFLSIVAPGYPTVRAEFKADNNHLIVGAASIIAKVSRDRELKDLGVNCSGYPSDQKTILYLKSVLHDLPEHVRRSWGTIARLQKESSFNQQ